MAATLAPAARGSAPDGILPAPRLRETDTVNVAMSPDEAWREIRHGGLAGSRAAGAIFTIMELRSRFRRRGGGPGPAALNIDGLVSTPEKPGFQPCSRQRRGH